VTTPSVAVAREKADTVGAVLSELESVLGAETLALRRLDRAAIEQAMAEKLRLCDALAQVGASASAPHRERLERLRGLALKNQLLLAHARDSVRDVLTLASGKTASAPLGGLRLDLRG
jgi:flagellar biosynthesis/type III secretory pathway chaperone